MQRATGQYDHLARVPRAGPRQSSGRRSFASRHRCRTAPRRSRGMEPTVRNPRIESAIGSEAARSSLFRKRYPGCRPQIQSPGTEFLDAETGGQKSALETADAHRDRKSGDDTGEIPAETAFLESPTKCAVWEDWMVVCAVPC